MLSYLKSKTIKKGINKIKNSKVEILITKVFKIDILI